MRPGCVIDPSMSASDRAYAFAKERILDGRYPGGELISEGEVAGGVGISRTPVREAFLRLELEGLLRLYPKRGALVVPVSATEVDAVMETRLLVERFAVEKAAAVGATLEPALRKAIARQERMAARGRAGDFVEADRELHRVFVAAAGNAILLRLHDSLRDRQRRMGLAAIARQQERVREILAEHERLTDAIGAGDGRRASEILTAHLEATWALLRNGAVAAVPPS
jgi:DNA-binding GntR family transcriptional regulator